MNPWPFVIGAYAVVLAGGGALLLFSYLAMRRAERRAYRNYARGGDGYRCRSNGTAGTILGAIVGGLFLEQFVPKGTPWAHVDTYAWNGTPRPGRPKGGAALSLFAALGHLEERFK